MLFTSVALAALLAGCEAKIGARKLSYQKIYKFTPKTQVTDHVSSDSRAVFYQPLSVRLIL
jgi:hypothetical protein